MSLKDKTNVNLNLNIVRLRGAVLNFIIPLICIAISILMGVFVLLPATKNKPLLLAELDTSAKLSAQLGSKKASLNELVDFRDAVTEDAALMDEVLVSEAMVPELLAQVSLIAQESGFEITRLTYSYGGSGSAVSTSVEETTPAAYETVTVSLGVRGSYDQLITFLASIEKAARLIDVTNYRFSRDEDNILDVNFVLTSPYLFVQSSAVTDEDISLDITSPEFLNLLNKVKALRMYKITPEDLSAIVAEEEKAPEEAEENGEAPVNEGVPVENEGVPVGFETLP